MQSQSNATISLIQYYKQDRNVILATTHEYRYPSSSALSSASRQAVSDDKIKLSMTSRFIGLVVIPGQHITRIELDEYSHSLV